MTAWKRQWFLLYIGHPCHSYKIIWTLPDSYNCSACNCRTLLSFLWHINYYTKYTMRHPRALNRRDGQPWAQQKNSPPTLLFFFFNCFVLNSKHMHTHTHTHTHTLSLPHPPPSPPIQQDREMRRQTVYRQREVDNQCKARERTVQLLDHLKQQETERSRRWVWWLALLYTGGHMTFRLGLVTCSIVHWRSHDLRAGSGDLLYCTLEVTWP